MEVDSSSHQFDEIESMAPPGGEDMFGSMEGGLGSIMKDLMKSVPGIDEAMAFGELMKMVRTIFLCIFQN
jgi:anion-transporting  ArsA/GET3 family ATPase